MDNTKAQSTRFTGESVFTFHIRGKLIKGVANISNHNICPTISRKTIFKAYDSNYLLSPPAPGNPQHSDNIPCLTPLKEGPNR